MVIYEVYAVSTVNVYATVCIIVYYVKGYLIHRWHVINYCLVTKKIHFWGRCFEIPYMYVLAKITTNLT